LSSIRRDEGRLASETTPQQIPQRFRRRQGRYFSGIGPLGRILHEVAEQTRNQVIETVRTAFVPYVHGAEVRFNAACWMLSARSPSAPGLKHSR
jgi:hypothetical protein